jgi:hypothetical protein
MRVRCIPIAISGAVAILIACSGGNTGPSGGNTSFTGTWKGPATLDKGGGPVTTGVTMVLTQTGSAVTGSYVDSITPTYADSGSLSGTVASGTLTFTITLNDPPPITRCSGSLPGTATLNTAGTQLTGSYLGPDCDQVGPAPNRNESFTLQ